MITIQEKYYNKKPPLTGTNTYSQNPIITKISKHEPRIIDEFYMKTTGNISCLTEGKFTTELQMPRLNQKSNNKHISPY